MDELTQQMTPAHDRSLIDSVLSDWYVANPRIRRAFAYQVHNDDVGELVTKDLYVLVDVEPVMDSDEVLPVWLAHSGAWRLELQARTACTVHIGWLSPDETAIPGLAGDGIPGRRIGVRFSKNDA